MNDDHGDPHEQSRKASVDLIPITFKILQDFVTLMFMKRFKMMEIS